jgi:hypothetical protein
MDISGVVAGIFDDSSTMMLALLVFLATTVLVFGIMLMGFNDGKELRDPVDGWTWSDPLHPDTLELHGRACAQLKSEPDGAVRIVVGCRTTVR